MWVCWVYMLALFLLILPTLKNCLLVSNILDGVALRDLVSINNIVSFSIILPLDFSSSENTNLFMSFLIYHAVSCHFALLMLLQLPEAFCFFFFSVNSFLNLIIVYLPLEAYIKPPGGLNVSFVCIVIFCRYLCLLT